MIPITGFIASYHIAIDTLSLSVFRITRILITYRVLDQTMQAYIYPQYYSQTAPQSSVIELLQGILKSRKITRADQSLLMRLSSIHDEEKRLFNEVYTRLSQGLVRVVD